MHRALVVSPAVIVLSALACTASAQRPAQVYGNVTGSIHCTDTNLPAHFATIALQPVREPPPTEAKTASAKDELKSSPPTLHVYRTHLDGSFQIRNVRPGRYYAVANNPGYLSPVAQFTEEEIDHPTPELRELIAKTVPIITVEPNATSNIVLSLVRAGSISGAVRFDDGSPAAGLYLDFERKDKDGKFVAVSLTTSGPDDQGRFRASGVPPGEYRMHTNLSVTDMQVDGLFGGNHSQTFNTTGGLKVYFGDTFFKKDAKTFKIEGGEEISADITVPASKIHTLTGSLVDARTGHAINAGTVRVFEAGESDSIASVKVSDDEPVFHLEYLPEGEYTVRIKDARDVAREEIAYAPGSFGAQHFKETTLKSYGSYESPLVVQADQTGLLIPIPALKPGTPAPAPEPTE